MYKILFLNFLSKKVLVSSIIKIVFYVLIMSLVLFFIVCPIINQRLFDHNKKYEGYTYYDTLSYSLEQINNVVVYETKFEEYALDECGISYNYAQFLQLGIGDVIRLEKNGTVSNYTITKILPSKITQIYDFDIDVNCGYIVTASGSGAEECAEDDVESELSWIYRKYFFGISNFEGYFLIVWFITQLIFFYNDTLKNNKLNKKDYFIISLLGISNKELFMLKIGISASITLIPLLLGSAFSALVYRYVFHNYLYTEYIMFVIFMWLAAYILGGLYGCKRKI